MTIQHSSDGVRGAPPPVPNDETFARWPSGDRRRAHGPTNDLLAERVGDTRGNYERFVKPRIAELLSAVDLDVVYHRAEGDYLWYLRDGEEHRVLDLLGGFGASLFGHNAPELVNCLRQQLDAGRPFNAQASVREGAGLLGKRLSELVSKTTGQSYVVTFSSTGAEAVEAALKHAEMEAWLRRTQWLEGMQRATSHARSVMANGGKVFAPDQLHEGRQLSQLSPPEIEALLASLLDDARRLLMEPGQLLAVKGAFHGKTSGALRLTHNPSFRQPWARWGEAVFLPPNDVTALRAAVDRMTSTLTLVRTDPAGKLYLEQVAFANICAIFCEPIQGEGGVRELSREFLSALRRAADDHGFPLVVDEIQCGMGRTGRFLASEWTGVRGDYYLLSKSLGGGLTKIAALLVERGRYAHEFGYLHTSTFAEDDHSSAVALKALELLERDDGAVLRASESKGEYLLRALGPLAQDFPQQVQEVRGRGLLVGIALKPQGQSPSTLLQALSEQKLLTYFLAGYLLREHGIRVAPTLSEHGTLRVEPSAGIALEELDRFAAALRRTLELLREGDVAQLCGLTVSRPVTGGGDPVRPALVAPALGETRPTGVGFLAHLRDARDIRLIEPRLSGLSDVQCSEIFSRVSGVLEPFVLGRERIQSALGNTVELTVVAVPFTAEQAQAALQGRGREAVQAQVHAAVALAAKHGASIVGCGGYTSIVSDNCQALNADGFGVTSGNSLSAVAAVEALLVAASRLGMRRRVLGVVGATGNIGAMLAELAAEHVERVILVGRAGAASRLQKVAARLPCETQIATDLSVLRECSLVVSASNAPDPILFPGHFGSGRVVVCDAAVPTDVSPLVARKCPNVTLLRGGLLRLPRDQSLDLDGVTVSPGVVYACLAESIVLGLSRMNTSFSYGPLEIERVRLIAALARLHGFTVEEDSRGGAHSWRSNNA